MRVLSLSLRIGYWILTCVVALFVFVYFLRTSGVGVNAPASVGRALTGRAYRPYAYRVLLPILANSLSPMLDKAAALRIGIQSETILGRKFFRDRLNGSQYPRQVILILIMMYLSLVGFAITMWHFLGALGYSIRVRYLAPPLLLLGCMVFFGFGYIYDFSTLFLFSLGLWLMASRKWVWLLVVFALGTLNKETTIFLYLIFALYYVSRVPRRQFISLSAWQLGIYAVIQGTIRFIFRNNRGDSMEWHFYDQLPKYSAIAHETPLWLVVWGAAIVLIAVLVIHRWREKPAFARVALSILPFFLVLFIFWAYPTEIRDMLEVYPIVAILMLPPPAIAQDTVSPVEFDLT